MMKFRQNLFFLTLMGCLWCPAISFSKEMVSHLQAEVYLKSGEKLEEEAVVEFVGTSDYSYFLPTRVSEYDIKIKRGNELLAVSSLKDIIRIYLPSPEGLSPLFDLKYREGQLDGTAYGVWEGFRSEENYQEGKPVGSYKAYYPAGQLYLEAFPENEEGLVIVNYYSIDGVLESQDLVKKGELLGTKTYYKSGALEQDIDGKIYYESGALKEEEIGKVRKQYYENGQLSVEENYEEGFVKGYYENGALEKEVKLNQKGESDGVYRQFYPSGQVLYEHHYKNGETIGVQKRFYKNGALYSETPFENNERKGIVKKYYPTGELWMEEIFTKMNTVVERKKYNRKGELISKEKGESLPLLAYPLPPTE